MNESLFWIIAVFGFIVFIAIIALIIYSNRNPTSTMDIRLGQSHADCTLTNLCDTNDNFICTTVSANEKRCLRGIGGMCNSNYDCASGNCRITSTDNVTTYGLCIAPNSNIPPIIPTLPGTGQTVIYCRNGEVWVPQVTIPAGVSFTRIVSATNSSGVAYLLGINPSTNTLFLYNGGSWRNLGASFRVNSLGTLVDATISPFITPVGPNSLMQGTRVNDIYLVYNQGNDSLLYKLAVTIDSNGSVGTQYVAVPENTGGIQYIGNQAINIREIGFSRSNDNYFYLVGNTAGSSNLTVYRSTINPSTGNPTGYFNPTSGTTSTYEAQVTGQDITIGPNGNLLYLTPNGNTNTIFLLPSSTNSSALRLDNIGAITSMAMSNDYIWFISNNVLYRLPLVNSSYGNVPQTVAGPDNIPINASSRLFVNSNGQVCFYTPGFN